MKSSVGKLACAACAFALAAGLAACSGQGASGGASTGSATSGTTSATVQEASDSAAIEEALNLANMGAEWTYSSDADAWTLTPVVAVVNPEIEDQQGVSVCVPGAYVKGVDTDGDGAADATDGTATGTLVIDAEAKVASTNGQEYTPASAPVILNTGAAGYSSSTNTNAASTYAAEGYINVSCGNRGKQDVITDADGNEVYTGDAPCCLVDQKNAARFVKYNILLGNLPGSVERFVSTGGSGGGAHATMFAATSNNPDFYPYEVAAGAVGVYSDGAGNYTTNVTIGDEQVDISDGAWGCVAYSAITSLAEADMAMAFEYYLDTDYSFGSDFQAKTAELLAAKYMEYINAKNLSVDESKLGYDLDGNGSATDTVALSIEYDADKYADTNGYGGTYLDLYLAEFTENLQWYLDNLAYAEDWTWFDEDGEALSDSDVAAMTSDDRAQAFLEGRYAKSSTGGMGGPGGEGGGPGGGGGAPSGMNGAADFDGEMPSGEPPSGGTDASGSAAAASSDIAGSSGESASSDEASDVSAQAASGDEGESSGEAAESEASADAADAASSNDGSEADGTAGSDESAEAADGSSDSERSFSNSAVASNSTGDAMDVGTPDEGTTQAAGSSTDSANYASYADMLAAYQADIADIAQLDQFGNNIVELYDPLNYIGASNVDAAAGPTWSRIVMGAAEGDMSMFSSLNLHLAYLNAGVDSEIEWQWDGGHVPSEVLGNSLPLYVDMMYGKHVDGAVQVEKPAATAPTANGDDESATGSDISSWVDASDLSAVSFTLADAASYRTAGASKAIPGFDVIDYGQEDYVFGSSTADARHWDTHLLEVFEEGQADLESLFNAAS